MPSHRMHRGLVALSASAVAAIYMAGYLRTQAADASIEAAAVPTLTVSQSAPVAAAAPTLPPPPTVAPVPQAPSQRQVPGAPRAVPTPQTASPPAAQTQGQFKDGTYSGQGTSRRGDVWVSVQIQGGQIANVTITRSTLQYPLRDIANLPSEVVQRQSAQVDIVSRATYSSQAFRGAVTQALSSARAG
ncbi:MAG: FMN-binding protein [Chloroflexi bacterium]|nr:FMN-binding protein [Chloroflexota bacterium]MBV9896070.1 FMN-binding protein [Chloroflexota bacterium]